METHSCPKNTDLAQPKIRLDLSDRYMTWLHRAGLAGLWMTLNQLQKQYPSIRQRQGQLDWQLSSNGIDLYWGGHDLDVLDWLLKQSFQIDDQGMVSLIGSNISALSLDTKIAIHQGITSTFLQHNKFYKSDGKKRLTLELGSNRISIGFKQLTSYVHQGFAKHLCDQQGKFSQTSIQIAGWLYPGAVVSHAAFGKQTKFEVAPEEALVLLFAPIACWYFMIPADLYNKQTHYALVIPEITDLATHSRFDWRFRNSGYEGFWATNLRDAGLRFLTLQENLIPIRSDEIRRCQSILFGKADWSSRQIVRTEIEIVEATEETIQYYQLCCKFFPENRISTHEQGHYITVSKIRGMIADNLAKSLPWWIGFAEEIENTKLFEEFNFTREGLLTMIEEAEWKDQAKKLFVKACHEALRRTYAKLYDQASEDSYVQIERCNTRIRSNLGRCKDAITFRNFLSRFFAKAGQVPTLQKHWEELLPITTGEVDWKLTRDLTLLALASYPKSETSEDNKKSVTEDLKNSQAGSRGH